MFTHSVHNIIPRKQTLKLHVLSCKTHSKPQRPASALKFRASHKNPEKKKINVDETPGAHPPGSAPVKSGLFGAPRTEVKQTPIRYSYPIITTVSLGETNVGTSGHRLSDIMESGDKAVTTSSSDKGTWPGPGSWGCDRSLWFCESKNARQLDRGYPAGSVFP